MYQTINLRSATINLDLMVEVLQTQLKKIDMIGVFDIWCSGDHYPSSQCGWEYQQAFFASHQQHRWYL